ncbi:hypothetical protein MNV49_001412 [Pseudohyphozyma bogoriensis]|nr:hypothetical protein MNV49_001412 [Pseudohyphozyma bogoriensis]
MCWLLPLPYLLIRAGIRQHKRHRAAVKLAEKEKENAKADLTSSSSSTTSSEATREGYTTEKKCGGCCAKKRAAKRERRARVTREQEGASRAGEGEVAEGIVVTPEADGVAPPRYEDAVLKA